MKLSNSVLTASLTLNTRRSPPAIPAQAAPAATPPTSIRPSNAVPGIVSPRSSPRPHAAIAPTITWPSPPTLAMPARAGTTTASAASTIGAMRMKISEIERPRAKVDIHMSGKTSSGFAPRSTMIALKITSAARSAAVQRATVGSERRSRGPTEDRVSVTRHPRA